jgi:hypothetical protein
MADDGVIIDKPCLAYPLVGLAEILYDVLSTGIFFYTILYLADIIQTRPAWFKLSLLLVGAKVASYVGAVLCLDSADPTLETHTAGPESIVFIGCFLYLCVELVRRIST